jgi:hypothetical protein
MNEVDFVPSVGRSNLAGRPRERRGDTMKRKAPSGGEILVVVAGASSRKVLRSPNNQPVPKSREGTVDAATENNVKRKKGYTQAVIDKTMGRKG